MIVGGRLKGATRLLFRDVGSLEAVAKIAGVGHSQAGRYQHADMPDFITIDKVVALESCEGVFPHVTQALASVSGHILVARPTFEGEGVWTAHMAATAQRAGALLSDFGLALQGDGTVDKREAEKLLVDVDQAMGALMSLRAALEKEAGTTPDTKPPGAK